ncbi:MAG: dipeptide epimerase [Terriglobales bacterium]|jgi:L-alanine-DL-glutamate epimerase-like enolase superfamily enzyme
MKLTRGGFLKSMAGLTFAGLPWPKTGFLLSAQAVTGQPVRSTQIQDVEIYPYNVSMIEPFRVALGTISSAENVLVRLRTREGVVGWGEAGPYSPVTGETQAVDLAVGKDLANFVRGRDPFALSAIVSDMDGFTPSNTSMKAALEMAVWDICGKLAGQPVYKLLGGYRDSFETDITIGMGTPEEMAKKATKYVQDGFKTLKVKLGDGPEPDTQRMKAIREAIGYSIKVRTDANQGWTAAETVRALRMMEKYQMQICEQPVPYWDVEGLKFARDNSPTPIMADESVHSPHDAFAVVRANAVDCINIKLMKSGGLLRGVQIATVAASAGVTCMVGCMEETRLALTAGAHLVASQKNIVYADLDGFLELSVDPVIGGMQLKNGIVTLPNTPGLGLDIDPAFFNKLHRI